MKIRKDFEIRRAANANVILHMEEEGQKAKSVFSLNETGELLWRCLERGADEEELFKLLVREYEVDEEQAANVRQDIAEFIEKLRSLGALEEV